MFDSIKRYQCKKLNKNMFKQSNKVKYNTVQDNTILYNTIQYNATLYLFVNISESLVLFSKLFAKYTIKRYDNLKCEKSIS